MKNIHQYMLAGLLGSLLALTACEKDWLDVNVDPENPTSSTAALTLPSGIAVAAYTLGNQLQFTGNFWAQHWTESYAASQYENLDRYQVTANEYDRPWQYLYAGTLEDFAFVSRTTADGDSSNYGAIADILSAYTFQVLVDGFDQIPFSKALQGNNNLFPEYDKGEDVYTGLIPIIDGALAKIKPEGLRPGPEDYIFKGNMENWIRFANTLKLKIYLRQIYARPEVARAGIAKLYADGAPFLEAGQMAAVPFADITANRNPFTQTETTFSGGVNVVASNTVMNFLKATGDPRIDAFFKRATAAPNTGNHEGINQGRKGLANPPLTPVNAFSKPSDAVVGPAAPVPFITDAESYFLQAEAALRGLATGAGNSPEALYEKGIAASFARFGMTVPANFMALEQVSLAAVTTLVDGTPAADPAEARLDRLITQKWVSMSGSQGFEAWTEIRRTGYPSLIKPSLSSVLPPGAIANRLPFASSEEVRNANTPPQENLEKPVWWDKR
jgi:hypothetical protein